MPAPNTTAFLIVILNPPNILILHFRDHTLTYIKAESPVIARPITTMGSQIAALLVNAGLKVKILDIVIDEQEPNKISKKAYETITNPKRPLLFDLDFASNIFDV